MALTQESTRLIRMKVDEAGTHLAGKLPTSESHLTRNSFAHVWERLRHHLGKSYKDCDEDEVPRILELIEHYKNNPC